MNKNLSTESHREYITLNSVSRAPFMMNIQHNTQGHTVAMSRMVTTNEYFISIKQYQDVWND